MFFSSKKIDLVRISSHKLHSKLSRAHLQALYYECSNKTESPKRKGMNGGGGAGSGYAG